MQEGIAAVQPVLPGMRRMLIVAGLLVFTVGISLFLLTEQTERYFAWTIQSALTAAFLGAAYWSSCVLECMAAREKHWVNARPAVPAVIIFTALTLIVTLLHWDRFHFNAPELITRAGTWFWLAVYAFVPIILAALFVKQRQAPGIEPLRKQPIPMGLRLLQRVLGIFLILLGVVMLISPGTLIPAWPWQLTPLTARAIGAWLIGLGIAAAQCASEGDFVRGRIVFISSLVFCVLQLIALLRYSGEFAWSSPQGLFYLLILGLIGSIGVIGILPRKNM